VSASGFGPFRLVGRGREAALDAIKNAPDGYMVRIGPPKRSLDQSALFHALCGQIAKAKPEWAGMPMDAESWKALLVVSHAAATEEGGVRLVPDLEGSGLVQLRESTATMSKARASSLIEYVQAWAALNGVELVRYDEA
jgi:hypothetical protein